MSRKELLSPEGLRVDGRRVNELRRISCRASVLSSADGSAYYEQGNTKILVAVYGPREPRTKTLLQYDHASINVEFNVAPFSTSERRKRSKGDKRLLEIAAFVKQTFEGAIQTSVYPRSQIDIYIHLLQHDGGTLETCINAATLALVDAGVSMVDYVCACTAGFVDETAVLDLNRVEESSADMPALTVAVLPRNGNIALLQMESKLHSSKLEGVMDLAIEGCKHIHRKLDQAVLAATKDLAVKLITIQDGQGAPYFLDKVNVKFATDFVVERQQQPSVGDVDELVARSISGSSAAEHADPTFMNGAAGINKEAAAAEEVSTWSPWYTLFRQHWVNQMQASEHESFMHPVACLLAVSSSEPDPIGALRSMQNNPVVRRAQTQSFTGPNLLFYYMLIHDERHTGEAQNVEHRFDLIRKAFGQGCSLLRINSNTDLLDSDSSERAKIGSIWGSWMTSMQPLEVSPGKPYGMMLTMRDVAALRDTVKQMMVRSIVPHMQYVVRILSDQTANQRRGITGRLFSAGRRYFGSSGKTSSTLPGVDGDIYFRYDSPEAMLRQLADYSFMLKDFRFAQSVYQVARRDYLAEKAWKCYAGAQEMVGLCKLMWEIQATKAEFDSNFEDAVATYLHKTQSPRPYLAIRIVILHYELLKHHRMYRPAPAALLRVPRSYTSLNGLMNEQAAYAFLKLTPRPEVRKFSFYAMAASQLYQKTGMAELAHKCLRMVKLALATPAHPESQTQRTDDSSDRAEKLSSNVALSAGSDTNDVIARSSWAAIDSFINHELGRQCMSAQNYEEAFQYFMALMGDVKIPPKLQSKYLQELLQLFLESDDRATASATLENVKQPGSVELSIPEIDPRLARVIMSPDLEGEDSFLEWSLDESAPSAAAGSSAATAKQSRLGKSSRCAVGETVAVLLVVKNPLTIGVTLNNFTLDCDFTPSGNVPDDESTLFDATTVEAVILEGGQTTMVTIEVVPRYPGELSIAGAKYLLCDILPTFKSLKLPGQRLNNTKEQQSSAVYSPDTALGFTVDSSLPHLDITLVDFPETILSGSMHQSVVRVVNKGTQTCRNIALWLSHPSFFDVKSPRTSTQDVADLTAEKVYTPLENVGEHELVKVSNVLQDCSKFVLVGESSVKSPQLGELGSEHMVPIAELAPGETLMVPTWTRGDRVGSHSLSMCIGASSDDVLKGGERRAMRSRTFELDLMVAPSLRVNAFVRSSSKNPEEKLLGIEIENMQTDLSAQLLQTTFSSGFFELVPISARGKEKEKGSRSVVGPRQTLSLMYRARPYQRGESRKDANSRTGGGAGGGGNGRQIDDLPEMFTVNALRQYIYSSSKPKKLPEPIDLVYSNSVLGDHDGIDCVNSSLHSYILRSQAHRRRNVLRANYPMIPERFHPVLFPLFESFGIDFVLYWREVGGAGRSGHHSITGIDLGVPHDYINESLSPPSQGAARAWLADTINERETLIQGIANRPSAVGPRHERPLDLIMCVSSVRRKNEDAACEPDFVSNLLIADVTITVHNHSWRYGYGFTLTLISPPDLDLLVPDEVRLDYSGSRSAWSWFGNTKFALSVGPQQSISMQAQLTCLLPGMIDIGLWRLRASAFDPEASDIATQDFVAPRLLYGSKSLECTIYPIQSCFVNVE
ncbi:hypothetical protein GGI07_002361 [Coemansia sp. Benny D115]|nr:hypothetical protein GGI07_002361 [Coemansia sp. Benny D115]